MKNRQFYSVEWTIRREKLYQAIIDYIPESCWRNQKVLEVGCGYGDLGNMFYLLGAKVTCFDARIEHIIGLKKIFPHLNGFVYKLSNDWPFIISNFNIILHVGTLYHLLCPKESLIATCQSMKIGSYLILETEYVNSFNEYVLVGIEQKGYNVAIDKYGFRPSHGAIEKILSENGMEFIRVTSNKYDSKYYKYSEELKNDNSINNREIRGIWLCKKGD